VDLARTKLRTTAEWKNPSRISPSSPLFLTPQARLGGEKVAATGAGHRAEKERRRRRPPRRCARSPHGSARRRRAVWLRRPLGAVVFPGAPVSGGRR
jgi:hypothetical protein